MKRPSATTVRSQFRRLLLAGLGVVALAGAPGCRLFEKSADGGTGNSRGSDVASRDPLFGGRLIPKQDIPIPGKSDLAESKDPLLRAGSASNDRREPFRLGPENTSAALAGKPRDDVPAIDDRPSSNNAGRGPVPFTKRNDGPIAASIPNVDNQLDELRRMGAKFASPTRDANGAYTFSAEVMLTADGPTRRYEGAGTSPGAAVQQVADQIKSDRK
jgi:hypothetical protein